MKPVQLRRLAKLDMRDAVAWYRDKDPNLAARFLDEVYKTITLLEQFPETGGPVYGVNEPDTRQLPVACTSSRSTRRWMLCAQHSRSKRWPPISASTSRCFDLLHIELTAVRSYIEGLQ